MRLGSAGAVALLMSCLATVSSVAATEADKQGERTLGIELNALTQREDACRVALLISNRMASPVDKLVLELVLFDEGGGVITMMSADAGAMPVGKSRLKQFDLKSRQCDEIKRILLNDVTACVGAGLSPQLCTAAARPTSRVETPFNY